jgi:hypothetical protein
MRKAFAVGVIVVMLGGQTAAMIPPEGIVMRRHWYWPFVNYPMYATPRHAGDVFRVHELQITRCGSAPETVSHRTLGMGVFRYWETLERIADQSDNTEDRELITRLVTSRVGSDACTISVRERGYVLAPAGWNPANDIPWHVVQSWEPPRP